MKSSVSPPVYRSRGRHSTSIQQKTFVLQGVFILKNTKSKNHDLGFYARFFESNWWKTMRLITAWRIKNNIEKSVRQSGFSIFELIASYRFFWLNGRIGWISGPECILFGFCLCCVVAVCLPVYCVTCCYILLKYLYILSLIEGTTLRV